MATRTSVKIFAGLFLFLVLAAIALLIAEIAYTASKKYPTEGIEYSSTEIWHWRKNLHIDSWNPETGNFTLYTDQNGFRNPGKQYNNDGSTIRVLVIGDSYTIGLAYPDEKTFTGILERKLNELHLGKKKIEVFNMASPAWGTEQQFLCLKNYGLKIKPDYVLLLTCPNDIRETYCKRFAQLENGAIKFNPIPFSVKEIINWKLSNYSCFYQYLQKTVLYSHYGTFGMLNEKYRFNFGKEDETNWDRPLYLKQSFAELDEAWNLYRQFLVDTKKLCDENKISLAVSSVPFLIEFDKTMQQDTSMQSGLVTEKIRNYCGVLNIPYVNEYEKFKKEAEPTSFFNADDQHFNAHGHEITAEGLLDYYKQIIH